MARKPNSAERARRLIALLALLTNGARIPLEELARQVDASPADLAADLEMLSMCGVAPYSPDALCPVFIDDGYVEVMGEIPALRGPVRLSSAEATALAGALQVAGFTAEQPLTAKLLSSASDGFDAEGLEHTVRSAIVTHAGAIYETLAKASQDYEVVSIEHVRSGSETATCREIEPAALFAERGAWYLTAWCRSAGGWRTFRVDRMRSAETTGECFSPRAGGPGVSAAFDPAGLPVARLRFAPGEPFTAREWAGGRMTGQEADGSVTVEVPYAGTAWVARKVVARLGGVEALEPAEVREAVRALAAEIL